MAQPLRVLVCSEIVGLREAASAAVKKRLGASVAVDWLERSPASLAHGGDARQQLLDAEVILADPGAVVDVIDDAASLRWMQSSWAGVNVLFDRTTKRDYTSTRLAGVFGPLMAEYVLGYILLHERRLLLAAEQQRTKLWDDKPFTQGTRPLAGLTLGLLGCGDIGQGIALAARALGLRTVAFKRDTRVELPGVDTLHSQVAPVLASADFIVNTLPSTPATRGLLGGDALAACARSSSSDTTARPPPILINVGRGDVMAEADIIQALEKNWLTAAVLDVFPVEPLPASSALWTHPKVHITPHVSAVSFPTDVANLFAENLELYLKGTQQAAPTKQQGGGPVSGLKHTVAWEKGY